MHYSKTYTGKDLLDFLTNQKLYPKDLARDIVEGRISYKKLESEASIEKISTTSIKSTEVRYKDQRSWVIDVLLETGIEFMIGCDMDNEFLKQEFREGCFIKTGSSYKIEIISIEVI